MDCYSVTNDTKEIDYNLLHIHHHEIFLNTLVNDIVTSLTPFWISQTPKISSNKSATFNPATPISDFTIVFASPGKDIDKFLKKSNAINADSYIDSGYEKCQIIRFKNEILQRDIKKLLDKELKNVKSNMRAWFF